MKQCKMCGKEYEPTSRAQKYCGSWIKQTGCSYINYRRGRTEALKPRALWGVRQSTIKKRDNYTCQMCGLYREETWFMDVDHKDGQNKNNKPDNLWTLCPNCHRLKTFNKT